MPRNFSSSSYYTQGAQGPPTPHRSTYQQAVNPADTLPNPNSDSSGTQLAQNSTGSTFNQHGHNDYGGNSVSRGNSNNNATSGQSHHDAEGARHSSSRTNSTQDGNHDDGSYALGHSPWDNSSSNSLSDSTSASRVRQSEREGPYHGIRGFNSSSSGGPGGYGSAGGVNQSGGHRRGYGGGSSRHVEGGYGNRDGDEDSLEAIKGSQTSGRSSGSRR